MTIHRVIIHLIYDKHEIKTSMCVFTPKFIPENHTAKVVCNRKTNKAQELLSTVMRTHYDFESYVLLKPISY